MNSVMPLPIQATGEAERFLQTAQGIFRRVDTDNSGAISQRELSDALRNPDGSKFENSTIRLMVKLFDTNKTNSLDFQEFYFLFRYFKHWVDKFRSMDADNSGTIDYNEFLNTLTDLQYRLSPQLSIFIFNKFARKPLGPATYGFELYLMPNSGEASMRLGNYIECLIWLTRFTTFFQKFDANSSGSATFTFEEFIMGEMDLLI